MSRFVWKLSSVAWVYWLLKFYELCGFHHSAWGQRKKIKFFIFVTQLLLMYLFTLNESKYILAVSEFAEKLGVLNFACFYSAARVTYWIIILESYVQKSVQKTFWKIHGQSNGCNQRSKWM